MTESHLYLREWLHFKNKKQKELVEELGIQPSQISDLVTGRQQYNKKWLEMVAGQLGVEPHLLLQPPESVSGTVIKEKFDQKAHDRMVIALQTILQSYGINEQDAHDVADNLQDVFLALSDVSPELHTIENVRLLALGARRKLARK